MKKATISVKINVADDFEMGDCRKCPIAIKEYKEYSYCSGGYIYRCPLGYNSATCQMEMERAEHSSTIQCKNCKFFVDDPNAKKFCLVSEGYDGLCVLKEWDDNNRQCMSTHNDDFCSLAEKR